MRFLQCNTVLTLYRNQKVWFWSSVNFGYVVNHHTVLEIHLLLLAVLHSTVNWVASTTNDVTFSTTPQQSFDGLNTPQSTGHVQGRLPIIVQLIHPRTHT